jgi:colicin import membrane protein
MFVERTMPRKVFRTHIGFQDWVVAATSRKAALAAWNVKRDLFKSGEAEETTDAKAVKAAMTDIGKPVAMPRKKARQ